MVFYPENEIEYDTIIGKIVENKINFIESKNLYWNNLELSRAKIIIDPVGFGIIISNLKTI